MILPCTELEKKGKRKKWEKEKIYRDKHSRGKQFHIKLPQTVKKLMNTTPHIHKIYCISTYTNRQYLTMFYIRNKQYLTTFLEIVLYQILH